MSSGTREVRIVFDAGWKIAVGEGRYGPFSSLDEAVLTARTWASNARRQGHQVAVSIEGQTPPDGGVSSKSPAGG